MQSLRKSRCHYVLYAAVAYAVLTLIACVSVPKGPVDALRVARDVRDVKGGIDLTREFYAARRREIPLAGTYRLTYTFPDEAPITLYVRTLANANVPIMITREEAAGHPFEYEFKRADLRTAYMVNAVGGASLDDLPAVYDSVFTSSSLRVGGYLVVTDSLGTDPDGTVRYLGGFWIVSGDTTQGDGPTARLYRAQQRIQAHLDAAEKNASKNKRKRDEAQDGPTDLFDAIRTVIPRRPDGSVVFEERYVQNGRELYRLRAERVSTDAYHLNSEALETPTVKDFVKGSVTGTP